jgi:RHS repeat-associated protein
MAQRGNEMRKAVWVLMVCALLLLSGVLLAAPRFDGNGNRAMKSNGTIYWYGAGSDPLDETNLSGNLSNEYIFFGGKRIARRDSSGNIFYYFSDHLGTSREIVQAGSTTPCYDADFYPYGGERWYIDSCDSHFKFTGKERDSESGLDNFGARYDSSSLGRFMTTDPVMITTERLMNPQQLNLYAYVANNPLRFIDPTGEILQCVGDDKSRSQCFADLQQIAGDAANRLSMDAKTGVISFDTKDLDMSKNEGASLVNDLVGSKNTYDFSVGPTIMTDKGPVRIDVISPPRGDMANLPTFGDQRKIGNPPAGVSDILDLYFNNPNITRASNTNLKVASEWTVAFHELAEAFEKIDGGKGNSYAAGHDAALQREMILRDQRPYLKQYNTGAGGPAGSSNPDESIIIKK